MSGGLRRRESERQPGIQKEILTKTENHIILDIEITYGTKK